MDLNTVTSVLSPQTREQLPEWAEGDAWLAGGSWLFSEPQAQLTRLIDLTRLGWPALTITDGELTIAATCTVAELDAMTCPPDWTSAHLIGRCCRAFLASFKIWKTATVGGNLCMALPAGPMISLTAALDGICTIWKADGSTQQIAVTDFVLDNQRNALAPGDLLRSIAIPLKVLQRRSAFRQISLTPVGRSAALLIGQRADVGMVLTISASTRRPVRIAFSHMPPQDELRDAIHTRIADTDYHDDVHGKPAWRKAMTLRLADEIRAELADMP